MPTNLPAVIEEDETLTLNKGYYKGVVFDIPGAEVNINGVWTTYNDTNKTAILSQNPFSIEWRLNSTLLRKLGYSSGDAVTGNVIVVDDEWHCLNMANDITFEIE